MAPAHPKRNKQYKHFILNTITKSVPNPIYTEADKHLSTCSSSKYLGCTDALPSGLRGSGKTAEPAAIGEKPLNASGYPWKGRPQRHGAPREPQLGRGAAKRERFSHLSRTPDLRSDRMGGSAVTPKGLSHHTSPRTTPNGGVPKHTRHPRPLALGRGGSAASRW